MADGQNGRQGMKIAVLVEGKTEVAFKPYLRKYLETRLQGAMPKLDFMPYDGRIPKYDKLKRIVKNLLNGKNAADHVIALTDVYTGTVPPDFTDAADAKAKMREWVGAEERFHPHVALHDFESWLLPYWATIQKLAKHNANAPSGAPETINHKKPPSYYIKDVFERGQCRDSYIKQRDAGRILGENDLSTAIERCPELKAFVNTILEICDGVAVP
jgi:hypothetical protein